MKRETLFHPRCRAAALFACAALFAATAAPAQAIENAAAPADTDEYALELDRYYIGAAPMLVLPQGGAEMRRVAGATIRGGIYLDEFLAAEFAAAWCEDVAMVYGGFLWHWWGYERLDPFFTIALADWIEKAAGPALGAGTFFHLDDHWSLRFDFSALSAVEHDCEMVYSLSLGIQRSW